MTSIRQAKMSDCSFILAMINELALFEKAPNEVKITLEQLEQDGFGMKPLYKSIILEEDGERIGFALFYNRYSTWKGKSLYLEDLYIQTQHRGKGAGRKVMNYLKGLATETDCFRFEWQVLDWNVRGIDFYKSLGATLDDEWINCRLEGPSLC